MQSLVQLPPAFPPRAGNVEPRHRARLPRHRLLQCWRRFSAIKSVGMSSSRMSVKARRQCRNDRMVGILVGPAQTVTAKVHVFCHSKLATTDRRANPARGRLHPCRSTQANCAPAVRCRARWPPRWCGSARRPPSWRRAHRSACIAYYARSVTAAWRSCIWPSAPTASTSSRWRSNGCRLRRSTRPAKRCSGASVRRSPTYGIPTSLACSTAEAPARTGCGSRWSTSTARRPSVHAQSTRGAGTRPAITGPGRARCRSGETSLRAAACALRPARGRHAVPAGRVRLRAQCRRALRGRRTRVRRSRGQTRSAVGRGRHPGGPATEQSRQHAHATGPPRRSAGRSRTRDRDPRRIACAARHDRSHRAARQGRRLARTRELSRSRVRAGCRRRAEHGVARVRSAPLRPARQSRPPADRDRRARARHGDAGGCHRGHKGNAAVRAFRIRRGTSTRSSARR